MKESHSHDVPQHDSYPIKSVSFLQVVTSNVIDTESGPHLPHHDQSASNKGRRTFSCIDRHGRGFRPNPQSENEAGNEQIDP